MRLQVQSPVLAPCAKWDSGSRACFFLPCSAAVCDAWHSKLISSYIIVRSVTTTNIECDRHRALWQSMHMDVQALMYHTTKNGWVPQSNMWTPWAILTTDIHRVKGSGWWIGKVKDKLLLPVLTERIVSCWQSSKQWLRDNKFEEGWRTMLRLNLFFYFLLSTVRSKWHWEFFPSVRNAFYGVI